MNVSALPEPAPASNSIEILAARLGTTWPNISKAQIHTLDRLASLRTDISGFTNTDTSIVVFGSLARLEATEGSDIDWTLLIDGKADPKHLDMAHAIKKELIAKRWKEPGPEGTFGTLAFSHQILHCIGGEDDSNTNTTRRILLLVESKPVGNREAWESVQNNILGRYLSEDHGLWSQANSRGVPLFLLNDIARYWRIMVVDFAYKQRERENKGYALRNIKLGLSRKLIYASGILACFRCELDFGRKGLFATGSPQTAIAFLRGIFSQPPLDTMASALIRYEQLHEPARRIFDAYNDFLGLLANPESRDRLLGLAIDNMGDDPLFQQAREIRLEFGRALTDIFLKVDSPIQRLMLERGVF